MNRKCILLGQSSVYRILKKKEVSKRSKSRKSLKYIGWERNSPDDL
jgi:hypothetical protein